MKKVTFITILLAFLSIFSYGQIVLNEPNSGMAHIKVYEVSDTSLADLFVYKVSSAEEANKDGLWFFVTSPDDADIKIFFSNIEADAQMNIYYVNQDILAGWRTDNKRYLFKISNE